MQKFIELLEQIPAANIAPPTNTIGHIFRHEDKENFISYWLAFLLDPECIGSTEPMSALLQLAEVTEPVDLSEISIIREHTFDDKRRIDFFIETHSHIIGIENKIWSGLQKDQLKDYKKQLSSKEVLNDKKLILILLYPKRNDSLPVNSKQDLHTFKPVTYEQLVAEFRKIRLNIFENLRATFLMEDFIAHMEEYIMENPDKNSINIEMWNFAANYRDKLTELLQKIEASKSQFGAYLKEQMSALVADRTDCNVWAPPSIHINTKETYHQLYKTSWQNAHIHFELLSKGTFPPNEMQVVLHTHEQGMTGKTEKLFALGKEVGQKAFPINYTTEEHFHASMGKIFTELERLVTEYTEIIDTEIAVAAIKK